MSDLAKIRPTKIAAPQTDTSAQPTQPLARHAPSGAPQGAAPQKPQPVPAGPHAAR